MEGEKTRPYYSVLISKDIRADLGRMACEMDAKEPDNRIPVVTGNQM